MFGYVRADMSRLSPEQLARYRGCYCGLCRALRQECGGICRMCLNYDITFLVLLLSSLYEPDERHGQARCAAHPLRPQPWWQNETARYAAHMNTALAYFNCLDDWHDARSVVRLCEARLLAPAARAAQEAYPRQCGVMQRCLAEMAALEAAQSGPDALAAAFGRLMAELFVWREGDRWEPLLRRFGQALGAYIYILDAVCDLEDDLKHGRFNPLAALGQNAPEHFRGHLQLLIDDAAETFERLPLVQDADILRNILYSGVWSGYNETQKPAGKEAAP